MIKTDLRVLALGSDQSILKVNSPTYRRFEGYTKRCEVILYAPYEGSKPFKYIKALIKFIRINDLSLIVAQDPLYFGLIGLYLRRKTGVKLCIHFHSSWFTSRQWIKERWRNRLLYWVARYVCSRADGIRVVSNDIRDLLVGRGYKNVFMVPTPVEMPRLSKVKHIADKKKYVPFFLYIGRLSHEKNVAILIMALKKLWNEHYTPLLFIVGDGPERDRLEKLARAFQVSKHIKFVGQIPHQDIWYWLKSCKCVVLPSIYEGSAKVLREAGLAEKPVISTAVSGADDIIIPSKTGWIVPIGDMVALADSMAWTLNYSEKAKQMGRKAREHILKNFDYENILDQIVEGWQNVQKDKNPQNNHAT